MKFILLATIALAGCADRCIPFPKWKRAIEEDSNRVMSCIDEHIACSRLRKENPGYVCEKITCDTAWRFKEHYAMAGYPDRRLVCENDCRIHLFEYCLERR